MIPKDFIHKCMFVFLYDYANRTKSLFFILIVYIFLLAFLYILFLGIFNEKALNEFDFNDIAMFTLSIIVSFVTAISIIKKYEPNSFLKKI